jgi:hypothetical protein
MAAAALERAEREVAAEAKAAQLAHDDRLVSLLDQVSHATLQDVSELDREAVERDHGEVQVFECPIYRVEVDKVRSW